MFLARVFGRRLFATATSEASAAGAAASSRVRTAHNPLEEFFEIDRNPEEEKPVVYGIYISILFIYLNFGIKNIAYILFCSLYYLNHVFVQGVAGRLQSYV